MKTTNLAVFLGAISVMVATLYSGSVLADITVINNVTVDAASINQAPTTPSPPYFPHFNQFCLNLTIDNEPREFRIGGVAPNYAPSPTSTIIKGGGPISAGAFVTNCSGLPLYYVVSDIGNCAGMDMESGTFTINGKLWWTDTQPGSGGAAYMLTISCQSS